MAGYRHRHRLPLRAGVALDRTAGRPRHQHPARPAAHRAQAVRPRHHYAAISVAARTGGSLLITSSPRSPAGLNAILGPALSAPHFLFEFQAGADNPYLAL